MSKQSAREETERLIREAMEKKTVTVKQGNTRIEAICGKCGTAMPDAEDKSAARMDAAGA